MNHDTHYHGRVYQCPDCGTLHDGDAMPTRPQIDLGQTDRDQTDQTENLYCDVCQHNGLDQCTETTATDGQLGTETRD